MAIFNIISNNQIQINMVEFIKGQIPINEKFPNPNRGSKFVNVFDNMVGQIEEEIYETKEALHKNVKFKSSTYQTNESLEEFVDSFMYIGSLLVEAANYFNVDINEILLEEKLNYVNIYNNYVKDNLNDRCIPHDEFLSHIRRKIYDRKYHKEAGQVPVNYDTKIIDSIIVGGLLPRIGDSDSSFHNKYLAYKIPKFVDNMNPFMQDLFFCYDNGFCKSDDERIKTIPKRISTLNDIINKKQNFISSL
jgi:hypothetical protein